MSEQSVRVNVRLFGAFRQFSNRNAVSVRLPPECRVDELRRAFAELFSDNENALALLEASAFATDEAVLDDADPVPAERELSILPPVCGG